MKLSKSRGRGIFLLFFLPLVLFGGGLGLFYLIGYINYGELEESNSYYYKPLTSNEPEKLLIRSGPAKINIKCNTTSAPYHIKADVHMKAWGIYMKNSDYTYFESDWDNDTSDSIIKLNVRSHYRTLGGFYHPTWTAKYDVAINITLRPDILYDLHLYTYESKIFISENLLINELILESNLGNIELNAKKTNIHRIETEGSLVRGLTLELISCNINESINVVSTSGYINFVSNNIKCNENVEWNLTSEEGYIYAKIYQSEEIGANITAFLLSNLGNIYIEYIDNASYIGALFTAISSDNSFTTTNLGGFEKLGTNIFRSTDYNTAINILTIDLTTSTGILVVEGLSS